MQKCSKDCQPVCDFCRFFPRGGRLDTGYCSLNKKEVNRTFMCDDFCCMNVKQNYDFSKLLLGLEGKWVIISEDGFTVLHVTDDLDKLTVDQIHEGVIMMVPPANLTVMSKGV